VDRADLFTSLPRSNPRIPGPGLMYPINGRCRVQIVLVSVGESRTIESFAQSWTVAVIAWGVYALRDEGEKIVPASHPERGSTKCINIAWNQAYHICLPDQACIRGCCYEHGWPTHQHLTGY
jgi:hypothetical protein